ncbi:MAG: shikimate kinase [Verrucomicrobiae bacterium]|nr:shikimate kinase [Verrucomicrobiae bacterium]
MLRAVNTTGKRARNLILIGFMGTGKTSVGMRVAKSLGFRFVDTDKLIVKKTGKPIPKIFEESGEEAFRRMETEVLRQCAAGENQVISTGGGIVTREENRDILREAGYVVWLRTSPEIIYERVRRNRNRPLLRTQDPLKTIRDLLDTRTAHYEDCSDLAITTDHLTMEETCYGVTESARLTLGMV